MNRQTEPLTLDITKGPSKYDFLESLAFRKHPLQSVKFTLRHNGKNIEIEVNIITIMPLGGFETSSGEDGHEWYFYSSAPYVSNGRDRQERLPFNLIGKYSTRTRTGWIKPVNHLRSLLLSAAFDERYAVMQLKESGFRLPKHDIAEWPEP